MGDVLGSSLIGGVAGDDAISEFAEKLVQWILKTLYNGLYRSVENSLEGLFDSLQQEITKASINITSGPKLWNSSAYSTMQTVAESVCIPIAGAFITLIFCWELIHLVMDSNAMQNVKPDKLMFILIKFCLCLIACARSFQIVMAFCDLGIWAASQLRTTTQTNLTFTPTLAELGISNPPPGEEYTLELILELAGYKIILSLAKIAVLICGILVYIRVMLWFVEFLLYASMAPIPYSTWMNKEWSQVGMNYTRKMLALAFEGFFMLLLFSVYGGVLGGLNLGDFTQSLVMIIGCGFALAVMMFKVGNISSSIFNAH